MEQIVEKQWRVNRFGAMRTGNIQKNGAIPKSHTSRGNFFTKRLSFTKFLANLSALSILCTMLAFGACGQKKTNQPTNTSVENQILTPRRDNNGKWGYVGEKGKILIPYKYDYAKQFDPEGLALVRLNDKYGYINKEGHETVPCKYDYAEDFSEGLATVRLNGKYGCVNREGQETVPCKYDEIGKFTNGTAYAKSGLDEGKLDRSGNFTVTARNMKTTLLDAVKKKYVRFSAQGSSINSSYMEVENLTDMNLYLTVPCGTYLSANSSSYQNMILTSPEDIQLSPKQKYSKYVNTACMNMHRDIPSENSGFGVGQHNDSHLLSKVIKLLDDGNYSYPVKQAAVWIVTDDANYDDAGTLQNQYGNRTINLEDYNTGLSVVKEARKMK
ncbi:MAG: WG repeat-containing protein [Prevotellaceae bacterium]|jgi:hypothetical protein|nr:WG repeat-containing protein [Prevotellaceae bacterium]